MRPIDTREIVQAFDSPGLFFAYQPVFELSSGKVDSVEALLRWDHETLGLIAPDRFLPLIHGAALSDELTRFSVRQVLDDLQDLRAVYGEGISVALNLSVEQLVRPRWVSDLILDSLATANESPSALKVELVEDATAADLRRSAGALSDLRVGGVEVLLDDFGTGASSLTSLVEAGYDGLKLDRSFVNALLTSETARSVVEAVASFGQNTGISVIAEGVESALVLSTLQDIGCGYGQGFHLGRPKPIEEFAGRVSESRESGVTWRVGRTGVPAPDEIVVAEVRALTAEFEEEVLAFFVPASAVDTKRETLERLHARAVALGRPADELSCEIGRELAMLESQEQNHGRVTEICMQTHRIAVRLERWDVAAVMLLYAALCPWVNVEEAGLRIDAFTGALRIRGSRSMDPENLAAVDNLIGMTFRVLGLDSQAEQWLSGSALRDVHMPTLHSAFACINLASLLLTVIEEQDDARSAAPLEISLARIEQLLRQVEANSFVDAQTVCVFRCRAAVAAGDHDGALEWAERLNLADGNPVMLANAYRAKALLAKAIGDNEDFLVTTSAMVDMLDRVAWYYRLPALRLHAEALAATGDDEQSSALTAQIRREDREAHRRTTAVLFEWIRRKVDLTIHFDEIFEATDRNMSVGGDARGAGS